MLMYASSPPSTVSHREMFCERERERELHFVPGKVHLVSLCNVQFKQPYVVQEVWFIHKYQHLKW
jgi:hypothetical protein